jgi:ketosteroid isomerase-like protein
MGAALVCALIVGATGCATPTQETSRMQPAISADAVVEFLHRFETIAQEEDFALIEDMIHERAHFRFNDGDFIGRPAIKTAFEKAWRGDPSVKKARFYLSDIAVLTLDQSTATATYIYNWEGSQGGREFRIRGRGTRVLLMERGRLRIIHEHLSRLPRPQ